MKLLAIDGNSILNRAYYGIKALTTKNGEFTNGIYGFLSILLKVLDEVQPEAVACAFDLHGPTFRHEMYDGYKAQRKGCPTSWPPRWSRSRSCWARSVSRSSPARATRRTISSARSRRRAPTAGTTASSRPATGTASQLVGGHVSVRLATTKMGQPASTLYDRAAVMEKYGVEPPQLIDVKALMGDASDNIPGVAGIGEKTALALVSQFHDLDAVYEHLDDPSIKPGVRKKARGGPRDGLHQP